MEKTLKIPEVGEYVRNVGRLVAIEIIQPPPPPSYKDFIFEDIETHCELRLNGEIIQHLSSLNDFYGLGEGIKQGIREMKRYCSRRNITDKSELEVVVIKFTSQRRMKPTNKENYSAEGYTDFECKTYGWKYNLPEDTTEIVWSSKNGS